MGRHVRLREVLIGAEGLVLLRQLSDGDDEAAAERLAEVRGIDPAEDGLPAALVWDLVRR